MSDQAQCNICTEKATRQGRMFVHTLAKFADARRGSLRVGVKLLICVARSKAILVTYIVVCDIDFNGPCGILSITVICAPVYYFCWQLIRIDASQDR